MARRSGHNAKLIVTGSSTAMTDESTTNITGDLWQVDDADRDILDLDATFVVEVSEDAGGTWETLGTDEYTLRYLIGRVDIDNYTSLSGDTTNIDQVRITGEFLEQFERATVHSSSNEKTLNLDESSSYGDQGEHRTPIRQDFTASVDDYDRGFDDLDTGEDAILDYLLDGRVLVFSVHPDRGTDGVIRAWVRHSSASDDQAGDSVIETSFDVEGSQRTPEMTSQTANLWDYRAPTS